MILCQDGRHEEAFASFQRAYSVRNRPEALFMGCINLVQGQKMEEGQQETFKRVESHLLSLNKEGKHSLILFYHSLVLLFLGKPSLSLIEEAIKACEEPVSEYYFIKALIMYLLGSPADGLAAVSQAIEIDDVIEEFFKERSKYHFVLESYGQAIHDCLRAEEMAEEDEEVSLLLIFYYYLSDEYEECWERLKQLKARSREERFREFEQALMLRLGIYDHLGPVGRVLSALTARGGVQKCPDEDT